MYQYLYIIMLSVLAPLSVASESHHHDHDDEHFSEQEAHLHGYAELTLVVEGNSLEIEFESPAANIVGFEHKAASKEQRQIVAQNRKLLETPETLFAFVGSDCVAKNVEVDVSALLDSHSGHNEKGHNEHAHIEHGHNEHGHNDGPHKEAESENGETHSEVAASYRFECHQGDGLNAVEVRLSHHFEGLETLKVMWATEGAQGAVDLSRQSNTVRIR